jgi:hypothetical protein
MAFQAKEAELYFSGEPPAAGISLIAQCGASRGSLILGILQKHVMAMV